LNNAVAAAALTEEQAHGKQIMLVAKDVEKRGRELVGSSCGNEIEVIGLDEGRREV
jgi:hypothetical protein